MDITRNFAGDWITNKPFENLKPVYVYHRQLEPKEFEEDKNQNSHILFRKSFSASPFKKAMLFISADDYYKLYINGDFVAQGPAPGYPFHYYYNKIDVSKFLKNGINTIAVHTYYQGLINRVWVSGDNRHGLILDLELDGKAVLKSDESFLCHVHSGYSALGLAGYKTQFLERYDSNSAEALFESPLFDDSGWENAVIKKHADYVLFEQTTKMLVFDYIKPSVIRRENNKYVVDFGSQYVGYLRLTAKGLKGGVINLRFGQELLKNGDVRFNLRANCNYEEAWVLSGNEDYLNQFDFKAFRYAEIILPEGCIINEDSICLMARHYPFTQKAVPNTGDPVLLDIWILCVNTLRFGVQEVIQDCMEREKGHYLGDGVLTSLTFAKLTGDTSLMEKLIDESFRTAFISKGLMTCATCAFMQEIAEYPLMLPWLVIMHHSLTQNKAYLAQNYKALTSVLDFYHDSYAGEGGLISHLDKWCVVDWPSQWRDGYDVDLDEGKVCTETHNVINAYYIGAIKSLNHIAGILGLPPYKSTANLEKSFIGAFYDNEKKLFRDSVKSSHISLPSNVFALLFELYPDSKTRQNIIDLICAKGLGHSTFFVTFAMLAALKRLGREDLVKTLLKDERGWVRMLKEGATVTFESWGKDAKWNTSLFHLTLSYAAIFLMD